MNMWWKEYISEDQKFSLNDCVPVLIEKAILAGEGQLSASGALATVSGKLTGRSSEDKYVVHDEYSADKIDWANSVNSMSILSFEKLKKEVLKKMRDGQRSLFVIERSVGSDSDYSLEINMITTKASHALFIHQMLRDKIDHPSLGHYTLLHMPELELDAKSFNLKSSIVIAINFSSKEIIIAGTGYAGESKKAIFSVMNTLLPGLNVLPLHSGANIGESGEVSVFLGLSGTGKTTLSTDQGRFIIGDDEHGLSPNGIFNLEGGCYAKTYKLSHSEEPQVFQAVNHFGAILENVVLDDHRQPQFDDKSITENGRGSYPLTFIDDAVPTSMGPHPTHIFFLSADAMGVLPAVAKLYPDQAMYYFLSGYTAKLGGTEAGSKEIKATFSHCFGAPFMMRKPQVYAEMLKQYIKSYNVNVWLINTGWYGGVYGVGKRYELSVTRNIVRSIQQGHFHDFIYDKEKHFGLEVPQNIPGVDPKFLHVGRLWENGKEYDETAIRLKKLFEQNAKKFYEISEQIIQQDTI